jgi:hypothetical protein
MQQGPGVLETSLSTRDFVMIRQGDGMYIKVPIDQLHLEMDLPSLAAINDKEQQVQAAMQGPAPEFSDMAEQANKLHAQSNEHQAPAQDVSPATTVSADHAVADKQPETDRVVTLMEAADDTIICAANPLSPACLSVSLPTTRPVVKAAAVTNVPAVITLPYGDPSKGLSSRRQDSLDMLPYDRTILDTGANMVIVSKEWADLHQLKYEPKRTVMRTSSGGSIITVGMLTTPILFVLCAGTHAELELELPVHVMEGVGEVYDILLGTPFTNPILMDICTGRSSANYCYRMLHHLDSVSRHSIATEDSALNPSAEYIADLQ